MPWWDILKRKDVDSPAGSGQQPALPRIQVPMANPEHRAGAPLLGQRVDPNDPEVQERRRKRLVQKVQNLGFDVQQAEGALVEPNRWTGRVEQLNQAIEQARRDSEAILHAPPGRVGVSLPEAPISVTAARATAPADISLSVGDIPFRYSEEIDWSERGHQKAPVQLQRVEAASTRSHRRRARYH